MDATNKRSATHDSVSRSAEFGSKDTFGDLYFAVGRSDVSEQFQAYVVPHGWWSYLESMLFYTELVSLSLTLILHGHSYMSMSEWRQSVNLVGSKRFAHPAFTGSFWGVRLNKYCDVCSTATFELKQEGHRSLGYDCIYF